MEELTVLHGGAAILLFLGMIGWVLVLSTPDVGGPTDVLNAYNETQVAAVQGFRTRNSSLFLATNQTGLLSADTDTPYTLTIRGKTLDGGGVLRIYRASGEPVLKSHVYGFPFEATTPRLSNTSFLVVEFRCSENPDCLLAITGLNHTRETDTGVARGENWYQRLSKEAVGWAGNNPTLFVPDNEHILQYALRSFNRSRRINVSIEGRQRETLAVPPNLTEYATIIPRGVNRVTFGTGNSCTVISPKDPRCVTVGIANITRIQPREEDILPGANTAEQGGAIHMTRNATLYADGNGTSLLHLRAQTIGGPTRLRIFNDGIFVTETRIDAFGGPFSIPVSLNGSTVFTLQTGCPPHCQILNVSHLSLEHVSETDSWHRYGENWYLRAPNESVRWGGNSPSLYISHREHGLLAFSLTSFKQNRTVTVTVNGQPTTTISVPPTGIEQTLLVPDARITRIQFQTQTPCTAISEVNNNDDIRCVTVGLTDLRLPTVAGVEPGTHIRTGAGLQLSENATVTTERRGKYLLSMVAQTIGNATRLHIFKDGVPVQTARVSPFKGPITTPVMILDGPTTFTFQTSCPEQCELINVSRLLLQRFDDASRPYRFGANWYQNVPAENYRWSNGNATIHIYNYDNQSTEQILWISGKSFHRARNITYMWNGEVVRTQTVQPTDYRIIRNESGAFHAENKYGIPVTVQPGENVLEIGSTQDCLSVGAVNNNDDVRCALFGFNRLYLTDRIPPRKK